MFQKLKGNFMETLSIASLNFRDLFPLSYRLVLQTVLHAVHTALFFPLPVRIHFHFHRNACGNPLSLQVCGFKIIRVTVSFAVTVNRNRHSKKNKEKKSGSLYIILFVTTCERRELLKRHRKRRK